MDDRPAEFHLYTVSHSALELVISDLIVSRFYDFSDVEPSKQTGGTRVIGQAVPKRDLLQMLGTDTVFAALPIFMHTDVDVAKSWDFIERVDRYASSGERDGFRQGLFDREAEEFKRRPPTATIYDSRPESTSSDYAQRLAWELSLPESLLNTFADDILHHAVAEVSIHIKFVFGFVRLVSTNHSGSFVITQEDVELSRALAERPDEIFGDRKIWGLCGIDGASQNGHVVRMDWRTDPRRLKSPGVLEPVADIGGSQAASTVSPRRGWFAKGRS